MEIRPKWQQLMLDDGCPEHLIRTPEVDRAAREYWIAHPPRAQNWTGDDETYQRQKALREQLRLEESRRRIAKMKAELEKKKQTKMDVTGLTYDQKSLKWVSVNPTQEDQMAEDGTYSSRAGATRGAKRAGLESFTIVEENGRFKYLKPAIGKMVEGSPVHNAALAFAAASESQPVVETAPTPAEQPSAATEEPAVAKKKRARSNGAEPTKVEQVILLCQRKSGCTLEDIRERLKVTQAAAASLIADVRRAHKDLQRDGSSGTSTYFL